MKVKFPKQKYNIGDEITLNLSKLDYNGCSLRSILLREIIQDQHKKYKIKKLTKRFKELALVNIAVLDNCKKAVVTGITCQGLHYSDYLPSNVCYVNGGYCGLDYYLYDVMVHAIVNTDGRMNHIQYRIKNIIL